MASPLGSFLELRVQNLSPESAAHLVDVLACLGHNNYALVGEREQVDRFGQERERAATNVEVTRVGIGVMGEDLAGRRNKGKKRHESVGGKVGSYSAASAMRAKRAEKEAE